MMEPLSVGVNGVKRARMVEGDVVVVIGAGDVRYTLLLSLLFVAVDIIDFVSLEKPNSSRCHNLFQDHCSSKDPMLI